MCKFRLRSCQVLAFAAYLTFFCLPGGAGVARADTTQDISQPPPYPRSGTGSADPLPNVVDFSVRETYRPDSSEGPGAEADLCIKNAAPNRSQAELYTDDWREPCGPVTIKIDCPVPFVDRVVFATPKSRCGDGVSPCIERFWVGLGGHRFHGKRFFPVFRGCTRRMCRLEGLVLRHMWRNGMASSRKRARSRGAAG